MKNAEAMTEINAVEVDSCAEAILVYNSGKCDYIVFFLHIVTMSRIQTVPISLSPAAYYTANKT